MAEKKRELIELNAKYGTKLYVPFENIMVERGDGIWCEDIDGQKYLDFFAAYSALPFGHGNRELVDVVINRLTDEKVCITSGAVHHNLHGLARQKIAEFTGFDKVEMASGGAEAVEKAIKYANWWGYKVKGVSLGKGQIISAENNFHGRTKGVLELSSDRLYKQFYAKSEQSVIVPYNDIEAIREAVESNPNVVAILIEPIQGEGGVIVPYDGYLRDLRKLCNEKNILLIFDEIQTGFWRTGKRFCYMREDAKPDLMTIAKAMSGGIMPISAVVGTKEVMGILEPGQDGSTWGGNPLACVIVLKVIEIFERMEKEGLEAKILELGNYFRSELGKIKHPLIKEVRGRGYLNGLVFSEPVADKLASEIAHNGLLCRGAHSYTIRLSPPIIVEKRHFNIALKIIKQALEN